MQLPTVDHKEVLSALEKKQSLPTLPTTFSKLLNVASDPEASFMDLATIIAYDPILTANVLRVANSSYMGLQQPAEDLSSAVVYLGVFEIRRTALAVGSFNLFVKKGSTNNFLKDLWVHSVTTGLMGQELASFCNFDFYEDAYVAGLLHDVGKLFFASSYPDVYSAIIEQVAKGSGDILSLERQVFGITHLDVGHELCSHWKLPAKVLSVASFHHNPSEAPVETRLLTLCTASANVIAHQALMDQPLGERLNVARQWMTELMGLGTPEPAATLEDLEGALIEELEQAKCYGELNL